MLHTATSCIQMQVTRSVIISTRKASIKLQLHAVLFLSISFTRTQMLRAHAHIVSTVIIIIGVWPITVKVTTTSIYYVHIVGCILHKFHLLCIKYYKRVKKNCFFPLSSSPRSDHTHREKRKKREKISWVIDSFENFLFAAGF